MLELLPFFKEDKLVISLVATSQLSLEIGIAVFLMMIVLSWKLASCVPLWEVKKSPADHSSSDCVPAFQEI